MLSCTVSTELGLLFSVLWGPSSRWEVNGTSSGTRQTAYFYPHWFISIPIRELTTTGCHAYEDLEEKRPDPLVIDRFFFHWSVCFSTRTNGGAMEVRGERDEWCLHWRCNGHLLTSGQSQESIAQMTSRQDSLSPPTGCLISGRTTPNRGAESIDPSTILLRGSSLSPTSLVSSRCPPPTTMYVNLYL